MRIMACYLHFHRKYHNTLNRQKVNEEYNTRTDSVIR